MDPVAGAHQLFATKATTLYFRLRDALSNSSFATTQLTHVVEFRPAHLTQALDLNLLEAGRVQREDTLNADTVRGDLTDREG